jgi:hypothetical protein
MEIELRGEADLIRVSRDLKRLGEKQILNNMRKEIRTVGKKTTKLMKANVLSVLPHRGGLNAWAARSRFSTSIRASGRKAGVSFVVGRGKPGGKKSDIRRMDEGMTRHPLWGNRKEWRPQVLPVHSFTKPVTTEGVREFREAIDRAIRKAEREVDL